MSKVEGENVCPQCWTVLAVREIHIDCLVAREIKKVATSFASVLKLVGVTLPKKIQKKFREIKYVNSPKKIIDAAHFLYKSIARYYREGALALASAENVIRPILNGLERLAKLIRKTEVFQGNIVLVP